MPDIAAIIQAGAANIWLYFPVAVLLGALHALEPGHSKSMMAAYIVAIRGTPAQAVMLGAAAAVGHTLVVWILAAAGLYFGDRLIVDTAEPWLALLVGLLTMGLAIRIYWMARAPHGHSHDNHHSHDTGHAHSHDHGAAAHDHRAHPSYADRRVTSLDIVWFGFTGGLLPCPSAIAVLLICIQLKAFTLGFAMVAAFSIGLAASLMAVGVIAAVGARKARATWPGLSVWSARLPCVSALIVFAVGAAIAGRGLHELGAI